MPLFTGGGYRHRIARLGHDDYEISWTVDHKHGRIRFPTTHRRSTDKKGALRFAKKWNAKMPEEPTL